MTFVIRNMFVMVGLLMVGLLGACSNMPDKAGQAAPAKPATADAATRQYTFGWKFTEGGNLTPRGGESKGVPVTLDSKPSAAWLKLQEPGISDFERDRRAILAMAGEFRTSFDFVEVAGFTPGYKPPAPYQTWATEKVYVLEDKGDFISLQHILVTRDVADDGRVLTPVVTKHWRQDWQYQPASMLVYRGQNAWQKQDISAAERKGAWSQTVYQVDDSPRYADVAPWQHFGNYSSWSTQDVWRPLPRREYTVRSDYQLLMGSNRHIILPTGWVHEQQNNKVVLGADGKPLAKDPVLAREIGFNRYERITGYDFTPGDVYLKNTEPFWSEVRKQWAALSTQNEPVRLRGSPDKNLYYLPLFDYAEKLNAGKQYTPAEIAGFAQKAVKDYLANNMVDTPAKSSY